MDAVVHLNTFKSKSGGVSAKIDGEEMSFNRMLTIDWGDGFIQTLKPFDAVEVMITMKDSKRVVTVKRVHQQTCILRRIVWG